jgi:hypothetical protein
MPRKSPNQVNPNAKEILQDSHGASVELTHVVVRLLATTTTGLRVVAGLASMLCRVASPASPMPALLLAKAAQLLRDGFSIPLHKPVSVNQEEFE